MTPEELARVIAESERKIELMEAFAQSEEWNIQLKRLEARKTMLANEMAGLIRRMTRPVPAQLGKDGGTIVPAVTSEQISYQQGRMDENADLMRFPIMSLNLWRDQLAQLHAISDEAAR